MAERPGPLEDRTVARRKILEGEETLCDAFERCLAVSRYLLTAAESWL